MKDPTVTKNDIHIQDISAEELEPNASFQQILKTENEEEERKALNN